MRETERETESGNEPERERKREKEREREREPRKREPYRINNYGASSSCIFSLNQSWVAKEGD